MRSPFWTFLKIFILTSVPDFKKYKWMKLKHTFGLRTLRLLCRIPKLQSWHSVQLDFYFQGIF